jgi:hypothetical protein
LLDESDRWSGRVFTGEWTRTGGTTASTEPAAAPGGARQAAGQPHPHSGAGLIDRLRDALSNR